MVESIQWRTDAAEEAIRPGRHFETGGKKRKKEKEKRRKGKRGRKKKEEREKKKNMEEACNHSKTKMEHLSCGALTHNLACWRPCPFWRKRVVRIYLLLRKMYRVIGTLYILAPLLRKNRHTNLSNRNLPFWRPFKFWRPYAEKTRIIQHFGAHMFYASYVYQAAGGSIIGGGAPSRITERHKRV